MAILDLSELPAGDIFSKAKLFSMPIVDMASL